MIFYVYLDPGVLSADSIENDYAIQALIGVLRGFTQNCFIAEFEDYRIQDAIKENVNSLPDNYDRKLIKKIACALLRWQKIMIRLLSIIECCIFWKVTILKRIDFSTQ